MWEGFNMETLKTIVLTLIGSGAMWGFFQFVIERRDKKNDKLKEILEKMDGLSKKIDKIDAEGAEREAIAARVRILDFMDGLLEGRRRTKDAYDQVICSDITKYEQYCKDHPEFKNNQTQATINYITQDYTKRLDKHDFL